ncbi:MAG: nucleotidyltransferase domain-containing protein [Cyanobacteria bacterium J06634_6]
MTIPLKNIDLPMAEIEQFCQKWNLIEFALFGSVIRDDFRPDSSDIDVMIRYRSDAVPTFYDLDSMEEELELLFGREVDVITRQGIEQSSNYLRRHAILSSAKVIYESARPTVSA